MSDAATAATAPVHPILQRIQFPALIAGIAGLVLWALSLLFTNHQQAFLSYLFAYMFWIGIPLGCFAILMLQHLSGGAWGLVIRRLLEAGTRMLPLMAILFVPLLFGIDDLYHWTHDETLTGFRAFWLDTGAFVLRAIIYFAIWIAIAFVLNKWSSDQDRGDRPQHTRRLQLLSGPGLLLYGLTVSGAAVDWVMSLDHHWYSTMFGLLFIIGQALGTLALMIALLGLLRETRPLSDVVTVNHFNDLGNLLLAFVMLWAYLSFSQYLIIWSGNIAEETPFYYVRTHANSPWRYIALALVVLHFFVPFLLLLSRRTKRSVRTLMAIALGIVLLRFVDLFWLIAPQVAHEGAHDLANIPSAWPHWLDILAPLGIGGICVAYYIWQIKRRPLVPLHDPRLQEVHAHHG